MKKTVAIRIDMETYNQLRKIKAKTRVPIISILGNLVSKASNKA